MICRASCIEVSNRPSQVKCFIFLESFSFIIKLIKTIDITADRLTIVSKVNGQVKNNSSPEKDLTVAD